MRRTLSVVVAILLVALLVIVIWIANRLDSLPPTPAAAPSPPAGQPSSR